MRTRGIRVILTATLVVAATLTSGTNASAAEPVKTTISHTSWEEKDGVPPKACSGSRNADVWEPAASGKYPVAIVTVGTGGSITAPAYQELAKEFGRQGFVAIIPDYNSAENLLKPIRTDRVKAKASCTYNPSLTESVMTKVCARAKADCTKGIVTSGHSQGGVMALLGYDYDRRVAAAHVWGVGNGPRFFTMDISKVRVIAGQTDWGGKTAADLNKMTGLNCTDEWECFDNKRNGNGWLRVRNEEVEDNDADHCFTVNGFIKKGPWEIRTWSCAVKESDMKLDKDTMNASKSWSYPANVTWLKKFVTP